MSYPPHPHIEWTDPADYAEPIATLIGMREPWERTAYGRACRKLEELRIDINALAATADDARAWHSIGRMFGSMLEIEDAIAEMEDR